MEEWLKAARSQSVYFAKAGDFQQPAEAMMRLRWAWIDDQARVDDEAARWKLVADRETLLAIAKRLLQDSPPVWLFAAVSDAGVAREFIPAADLADLLWLEPELDQLLIEAGCAVRSGRDEERLKRIGDAAELYLMMAFTHAGLRPRHAALWADAVGYDIELPGPPIQRIEVKASSPGSQGRFRLTRNEFDKSLVYGREWRVLQVIFANAAFVAPRVMNEHVLAVHALPAGAVASLAPPDTAAFRWMESAQFHPKEDAWSSFPVSPHPNFSAPGFQSKPARPRQGPNRELSEGT